jgi:DNA polymerase-3 subunit epsilon
MKLKLERNLVVFDIESTGLSVKNDRIVQLAVIKLFADGDNPIERKRMINPTIPIPAEAAAVHGITDDMVREEPTFQKVAKNLFNLIDDSDFCTFNGNRFDIPMLMEEFARCGMELDMTAENA